MGSSRGWSGAGGGRAGARSPGSLSAGHRLSAPSFPSQSSFLSPSWFGVLFAERSRCGDLFLLLRSAPHSAPDRALLEAHAARVQGPRPGRDGVFKRGRLQEGELSALEAVASEREAAAKGQWSENLKIGSPPIHPPKGPGLAAAPDPTSWGPSYQGLSLLSLSCRPQALLPELSRTLQDFPAHQPWAQLSSGPGPLLLLLLLLLPLLRALAPPHARPAPPPPHLYRGSRACVCLEGLQS